MAVKMTGDWNKALAVTKALKKIADERKDNPADGADYSS